MQPPYFLCCGSLPWKKQEKTFFQGREPAAKEMRQLYWLGRGVDDVELGKKVSVPIAQKPLDAWSTLKLAVLIQVCTHFPNLNNRSELSLVVI